MRMILPTDIDTLDNFKRQSKREIQKLKRSGRPKVLTINGKAAVIVQDASAYENLIRWMDQVDCIEAVQQGAAEADAGKLIDADEYFRKAKRRIRDNSKR